MHLPTLSSRPSTNLLFQSVDNIRNGECADLARAAFEGRGFRIHLCVSDDEHVRDFLQLCPADALAERIVGGEPDADIRRAELLQYLLCVCGMLLRDGKDLRLHGREPERECTLATRSFSPFSLMQVRSKRSGMFISSCIVATCHCRPSESLAIKSSLGP